MVLYDSFAPVAQLDRACGFGPQGSGFESWQARKYNTRPHSLMEKQLPLKQLT